MKLYITNSSDEIKGYTTLSPLRGHNIRKLGDDLVADSECTEILCPTITDFIPCPLLVDTLQNYSKKIRLGGKLIIGGSDIFMLTLMVARRECSVIEANQMIYGGLVAHECKSGLVGINDIAGLLEEIGLKINKKSLNGINFIVEAERVR